MFNVNIEEHLMVSDGKVLSGDDYISWATVGGCDDMRCCLL